MRRMLLLAAAGLALAATPAGAAEHVVDMPGKYFQPAATSLLVGDTVTWKNSDAFGHDIAALDGSFESGLLSTGGHFSFTFQRSGHVAYRCTIHPFMAGTLDVYAFQLRRPAGVLSAGRRAVLSGLAPGGVTSVTIEQRRPDGTWAPVVTRPRGRGRRVPGHGGAGGARGLPRGRGGRPSRPLRLPVGARLETTVKQLAGGRTAIRATARQAQTGAVAALQLYSRERYRWRQVAHTRVDRRSQASFVVSLPRRYAARVVLLNGRGGYGPAVGPTRRVGPGRSRARRHRPAMPHMHH